MRCYHVLAFISINKRDQGKHSTSQEDVVAFKRHVGPSEPLNKQASVGIICIVTTVDAS